MSASSDLAELSTVHAQIEELTNRIVGVADRYRSGPDSGLAGDLDQVERSLVGATRALRRVEDELAKR